MAVDVVGSVILAQDTHNTVIDALRKQFPSVAFAVENVTDDIIHVFSEEDLSEDVTARERVRIAIEQTRAKAEPMVRAWQLHELAYVPPELLVYPLGRLDLQALMEDVTERAETFQWDQEEIPGDGDPDEIAIVDLVPYGAERGWRLVGRCTPEGNVAWELSRA